MVITKSRSGPPKVRIRIFFKWTGPCFPKPNPSQKIWTGTVYGPDRALVKVKNH